MMPVWFLIIWLSANAAAPQAHAFLFESEAACQGARQNILETLGAILAQLTRCTQVWPLPPGSGP